MVRAPATRACRNPWPRSRSSCDSTRSWCTSHCPGSGSKPRPPGTPEALSPECPVPSRGCAALAATHDRCGAARHPTRLLCAASVSRLYVHASRRRRLEGDEDSFFAAPYPRPCVVAGTHRHVRRCRSDAPFSTLPGPLSVQGEAPRASPRPRSRAADRPERPFAAESMIASRGRASRRAERSHA